MSKVTTTIKWNPGKQKELKNNPNKVMYEVARMTLDLAYNLIPMSKGKNAGNLRRTSMEAGVRGSNGNYYIGSYTKYAKRVWNFPSSTNWSTSGTNNKWYERTWKKDGKKIISTAIERNKLK